MNENQQKMKTNLDLKRHKILELSNTDDKIFTDELLKE